MVSSKRDLNVELWEVWSHLSYTACNKVSTCTFFSVNLEYCYLCQSYTYTSLYFLVSLQTLPGMKNAFKLSRSCFSCLSCTLLPKDMMHVPSNTNWTQHTQTTHGPQYTTFSCESLCWFNSHSVAHSVFLCQYHSSSLCPSPLSHIPPTQASMFYVFLHVCLLHTYISLP